LVDFANTGNEPDRVAYFLKRWSGFLEGTIEKLTEREIAFSPLATVVCEIQGIKPLGEFQRLREYVRSAWRGSETAIALLLWLAFEEGKSNLVMPDWQRGGFRYEPKTALQAAVYELLKHSRQARVCLNPECATPYFITLDQRRKFCSPECAKPSQQEWKRRWWERKGKLWRKARKERESKQGRTKR
jgi:hypothetical protein